MLFRSVLALGSAQQTVYRLDDHLDDVDVLPFIKTADAPDDIDTVIKTLSSCIADYDV